MRRHVIVSCAFLVAFLLCFAVGAEACQITCPDGSSCSVWFGTCVCFNDGHAYCFPEDPGGLDFAAMSQPVSRLADKAAVSNEAALPSSPVETGAAAPVLSFAPMK